MRDSFFVIFKEQENTPIGNGDEVGAHAYAAENPRARQTEDSLAPLKNAHGLDQEVQSVYFFLRQ